MPANIIRNIGYWQHQSGWSRWSSGSIECAEDRGPARRACSAARLPRASECAASGSPARSRSSEATVEP